MKKIIWNSILIMITFFSIKSVVAQGPIYGIKGGTNFSTITTNMVTPYEYTYKAGFQFGVFVKLKMTNELFFQPELLYSLQGTKYSVNLLAVNLPQDPNSPLFINDISNIKTNESYIILPILLKYFFGDKLSLLGGPQIDYMFRVNADNVEMDNGEFVVNGKNSWSVSEFNWGLDVGIAYDFNKKIGIEFRYNYGFNRDDLGDINSNRFGNSVFLLNLEYRFN